MRSMKKDVPMPKKRCLEQERKRTSRTAGHGPTGTPGQKGRARVLSASSPAVPLTQYRTWLPQRAEMVR